MSASMTLTRHTSEGIILGKTTLRESKQEVVLRGAANLLCGELLLPVGHHPLPGGPGAQLAPRADRRSGSELRRRRGGGGGILFSAALLLFGDALGRIC